MLKLKRLLQGPIDFVMPTDTSEKGLEALIVAQMTGAAIAAYANTGMGEREPEPFVGLHNWLLGDPQDYDRA